MIVTARPHIPRYWIFVAILPWSAFVLQFMILGAAFPFSLKKFIENPAGLTFVMSLPGFVSMAVNPFINFISDRVWTRFGRRKPFVVFSWVGTITCMILLPLMPNFWCLLIVYMLFNLFNDFAAPIDVLKQEIAPPQDRGQLTAGWTWMTQFSILTFFSIALGRFDDQQFMAGVPITGEQAIYWVVASAIFCMLMIIVLCIKETNPHSHMLGEKFSIPGFFKGILSQHLWPVYVLIFSTALLQSGLGVMGNLLYTDQWNFSLQEMGTNYAIGGVINLFLIGFLAIFANKMNRAKAYLTLNIISCIINVCFYVYVNFVLYDSRPSLAELVVFGETLSIVGYLSGMVFYPLCYDFVTRNEMGTFNAGMQMLNKLVGIVTLNGVGIFMWAYASLLLPPGGEMTRVAFHDEMSRQQVESRLASATWNDPSTGATLPPKDITATPWYATGAVVNQSRAFELRLRDKNSVEQKSHRDKQEEERAKFAAQESNETELARQAGLHNDAAAQAKHLAKAEELRLKVQPLADEIAKIDAELARRAQLFQAQINNNLKDLIVQPGEQILAASTVPLCVAEFPLSSKPSGERVERALSRLRASHPEVVDLRIVYSEADGYRLAVSFRYQAPFSPIEAVKNIGPALHDAAAQVSPDLAALLIGTGPKSMRTTEAITTTLRIIEDPLDRHISPVTRVVNALTALFVEVPGPDRRLNAMSRNLTKSSQIEHARVETVEGDIHSIAVTVLPGVPAVTPTKTDDKLSAEDAAAKAAAQAAIAARFKALITGNADYAYLASTLFSTIVDSAQEQRMTIVQPIIKKEFAAQKYDYMCGYIWMFVMQAIGLVITWAFVRKVERGEIRKRGVEEAEATEKQEAELAVAKAAVASGTATDEQKATNAGGPARMIPYIPGYVIPKLLVFLFGVGLVSLACSKLVPDLSHVLFGKRTEAEVVRVVKERPGDKEIVFTDDLALTSAHEKRDRNWTFWMEYQFTTEDGKKFEFRAPFGTKLKPSYGLRDADGLPTSVPVWYDPAAPQSTTLAMEMSTWFLPGYLFTFGFVTMVVLGIALLKARTPVDMPDLSHIHLEDSDEDEKKKALA